MAQKTPYNGFRKLHSHELDSGYAVLADAYEWLKSRGSNQWPQPFPYEKYRRWHEQGLNYGFFYIYFSKKECQYIFIIYSVCSRAITATFQAR